MERKNDFKNLLIVGAGSVAILIIIILGVQLLTPKPTLTDNTTSQQNNATTTPAASIVIPVDDPKKIKLDSFNVTLSGNWRVDTILRGVGNTDYLCSAPNQDLCEIYFITDDTNRFYLSIPSTINFKDPNPIKFIKESDFDSQSGTLQLQYFITNEPYIVSDKFDAAKAYADYKGPFSQVLTCLNQTLCAGSGILSNNSDENANQITSFKDFLNSVTINNK